MPQQHSAAAYVIPGLIAAVFIGPRLWRSGALRKASPGRRLRLEYLWITPALLTVAAVAAGRS